MARPALREPTYRSQERSPLLYATNKPVTKPIPQLPQLYIVADGYIHRVLFLALSASLAMAATAATTVFAYAVILCEDPVHCKGKEVSTYSGAVALAAGTANICGILALVPLRYAVQLNAKYGLLFWLISRGMSVAILAVAGRYLRDPLFKHL